MTIYIFQFYNILQIILGNICNNVHLFQYLLVIKTSTGPQRLEGENENEEH